eukprot:TRINITY_DN32550_c0_g1_i1.p1 TRINITY_DN32550_c0_g1~~TRINITY_DN32550_c0_g1_i1.p1  ORF type:complete len:353 (-),score=75.52 TRINITY_DN32550_c0_g1_i1:100-1158(-)
MEATLSVSKQTGIGRFRIEGFSLLHRKKGEPVSSGPIIQIGDSKWEILVYPTGNERCKDGWIRVSVRCVSGQREVRALYSVSVMNAAGEVKHRLEEEAFFTNGDGWGFDNFIRQERLIDPSKGFTDDLVIFEACVTVLGQEIVSVKPLQAEPKCEAEDLIADLRALWDTRQGTDLVLQFESTALQVHGLMLAARSPVFARMLSAQMTEASSRLIKIEDVDPDIMQWLCEFIYTGTLRDERPWSSEELAGALLQAAAKYEVRGLVHWCSTKVAATLTVDTVAEWLILATQIGPQAGPLKDRCLQVVAGSLSEVQATEGWQRLMQNARVVSEVAPLLFQAISPPPPRKKAKLRQ